MTSDGWFPIIDLDSPTGLAFEWGWLLATVANAVVVLLLVVVFVLGVTVRVPGVRRDIERVAERNPLAHPDEEATR